MFFDESRYPGIRLEELEGYRKENTAKYRFFFPYTFITLPALIGFIGLFVGLLRESIELNVWWWFFGLACFAGIVGSHLHAYRSTPRSAYTGKPMQIFRNLSAPEGVLELIYVDEDSLTYFRVAYAGPPGDS